MLFKPVMEIISSNPVSPVLCVHSSFKTTVYAGSTPLRPLASSPHQGGEPRVLPCTGYGFVRTHFFHSAGMGKIKARPGQGRKGCQWSRFPLECVILRLAPSRGELSAKLTERG